MLKFLLGNAKTRNASVPIGVASDNLTTFSPVRSPRNRHGATKEKEMIRRKLKPRKMCQIAREILPQNCKRNLTCEHTREPLHNIVIDSSAQWATENLFCCIALKWTKNGLKMDLKWT